MRHPGVKRSEQGGDSVFSRRFTLLLPLGFISAYDVHSSIVLRIHVTLWCSLFTCSDNSYHSLRFTLHLFSGFILPSEVHSSLVLRIYITLWGSLLTCSEDSYHPFRFTLCLFSGFISPSEVHSSLLFRIHINLLKFTHLVFWSFLSPSYVHSFPVLRIQSSHKGLMKIKTSLLCGFISPSKSTLLPTHLLVFTLFTHLQVFNIFPTYFQDFTSIIIHQTLNLHSGIHSLLH